MTMHSLAVDARALDPPVGGDLAVFSTWCPKDTTIETLVEVKGLLDGRVTPDDDEHYMFATVRR